MTMLGNYIKRIKKLFLFHWLSVKYKYSKLLYSSNFVSVGIWQQIQPGSSLLLPHVNDQSLWRFRIWQTRPVGAFLEVEDFLARMVGRSGPHCSHSAPSLR